MQPIPMQPMLMPFPCPVVTVTDAHGADAHAANTDAVCGILFWWYSISMAMMLMPFPCPVVTVTDAHGTDAHATDTDAVCGILFWWYSISMAMIPISMQPIPIPCVASSGGDSYRCSWN